MMTLAQRIEAGQQWGLAAWLAGMDPVFVQRELLRRWHVKTDIVRDFKQLSAAAERVGF